MAKSWFLDYVGKSMAKSRVREMCRLMELSDKETRLVLERFCDRKTMDQCDFLPPDQQKELLPGLDGKVRGWCEANIGFFTFTEIAKVCGSFQKRQATE